MGKACGKTPLSRSGIDTIIAAKNRKSAVKVSIKALEYMNSGRYNFTISEAIRRYYAGDLSSSECYAVIKAANLHTEVTTHKIT